MMSIIRRYNIPLISRPETVTRQYIKESLYLWFKKDFRKILNTTVGLEQRALQAGDGNDSSLVHELTHIIFGVSFSRSLEDGLCDYVQYRVGMQRFIWGGQTGLERSRGHEAAPPFITKAGRQSAMRRLRKARRQWGWHKAILTAILPQEVSGTCTVSVL